MNRSKCARANCRHRDYDHVVADRQSSCQQPDCICDGFLCDHTDAEALRSGGVLCACGWGVSP